MEKISYITHRSEDTRCYFCKNKCLRTFIDVKLLPGVPVENIGFKTSKIPIADGTKRLIVNNSCDRGLVEDVNAMREIKKGMDSVKDANPNMAEVAAKMVFKSFKPPVVSDAPPRYALTARTEDARGGHEAPRQPAHRHSARAEPVHVQPDVQRLL